MNGKTIRVPKGSEPKNMYQAKILAHFQAMTAQSKQHRNGFWIGCHCKVLRKIAGRESSRHVAELIVAGKLEVNDRYRAGEFAKSYRLAERYRIPETDVYDHGRRFKIQGRIRIQDHDDVGLYLVQQFGRFQLPAKRFRGWANYSYQAIQDQSFYACRCSYGRFHSTYTGMPNTMRQMLQTSTGELSEVDVSNCQSLILGLLMKGNSQSTKDLERYLKLCSEGRLYDHLTVLGQRRGMTLFDFIPEEKRHAHASNRLLRRNDLKNAFIVAQFASHDLAAQLPVWSLISSEFPSVASFMALAKRNGHQELARRCQRFESSLIVGLGGVVDQFRKELPNEPILTIHDAIVVKQSYSSFARDIIVHHFSEKGASPTVKITGP